MADLIGFVCTDFEGYWPVGTAAVVFARDREQAKRVLCDKLREQQLGRDDPDGWTLEPITPAPDEPKAIILRDGNY